MTPKQADKAIAAKLPVLVRNDRFNEEFWTILVSRDRFGVRSIDGGLFDRGELRLLSTGTRSASVSLERFERNAMAYCSTDLYHDSITIPFGHNVL